MNIRKCFFTTKVVELWQRRNYGASTLGDTQTPLVSPGHPALVDPA